MMVLCVFVLFVSTIVKVVESVSLRMKINLWKTGSDKINRSFCLILKSHILGYGLNFGRLELPTGRLALMCWSLAI